jgi:hypothetical protein
MRTPTVAAGDGSIAVICSGISFWTVGIGDVFSVGADAPRGQAARRSSLLQLPVVDEGDAFIIEDLACL